jgi:hypothetical protein
MIIQTDIEKEPDNILFSFMILKKLPGKQKQGNFLNLLRRIYRVLQITSYIVMED